MSSTRITQRVNTPRTDVYRALLDPHAVATWMVPDGMTSHVHEFDAREGGCIRISLTLIAQQRFRDEELFETRATLALPEARSDDYDAVVLGGAADQR